jgi:hypothetical protein
VSMGARSLFLRSFSRRGCEQPFGAVVACVECLVVEADGRHHEGPRGISPRDLLSQVYYYPIKRGERISVELRGAHLVWWLAWAGAFSAAVSGLALDLPRCLFGSLVAVAIGGLAAKVCAPSVGLLSGVWSTEMRYNGRHEGWRRYYLFWSRGIVPVGIALAPGLGYVLWCLASGWLQARGS